MEQKIAPTKSSERAELSFGECFRTEFPYLNLVHEIEIRGSCRWETLAETSLCLLRFDAELLSMSAHKYGEEAQTITCRIRSLEERSLGEAVLALKRLEGVKSILLSHHLGRASGLAHATRRPNRAGLGSEA